MPILEIDVGDLRADGVEFTATELVVTLADGRKIATPLDWYPRLKRASSQERANFEIMPRGIHCPNLDESLGIAGMLKGRRAGHRPDGRRRRASEGCLPVAAELSPLPSARVQARAAVRSFKCGNFSVSS